MKWLFICRLQYLFIRIYTKFFISPKYKQLKLLCRLWGLLIFFFFTHNDVTLETAALKWCQEAGELDKGWLVMWNISLLLSGNSWASFSLQSLLKIQTYKDRWCYMAREILLQDLQVPDIHAWLDSKPGYCVCV